MTSAAQVPPASQGERRPRLAVVLSHPIQYFAPLFAHIARQGDIDLEVLYLSDASVRGSQDKGFRQPVKWDIDLLGGYAHRFVGPNAHRIVPGGFWSLATPRLWGEIRRGRYDAVVIHGHAYAANFIAIAAAKWAGTAVIMRGESHLGLTRHGLKAVVRRHLLSRLYRVCDGFLAIGTANREFYQAFGVEAGRVSLAPYTVDNERFMRDSALTDTERSDIRAALGAPLDATIVLFASKFQRRKHPDSVIHAVKALRAEGINVALLMVGTGEMEGELRSLAQELPPKAVTFAGFVNQSRLPRILGASDVFVLPSEEEPWGLIVNEAMCAGLPVVVGDKLGCARDLVRNGENGYLVPSGDVDALTDALRKIVTSPDLRQAMSDRSREIVRGWSFVQCASGFREALNKTIGARETIRH